MIILGSALFVLSCFTIGRALIARHSALALGLGFGLVSYCFVVLKWLSPESNFAIVHWVIFGLSLAVIWGRRREFGMRISEFACPPPNSLSILFIAGCAVCAYIGIREAIALPHGEWDGWAIWNLHARFLARGGADWTGLFSPGLSWTHGDYPLMLPALIAAGWRFTSSETVLIPIALTLLFCIVTVTTLVASVHAQSGRTRALLAGLILVATPKFWLNGTIQTADIPLAFFILATVVLLWFSDKDPKGDVSSLALAGFAASLAAWTKNEGLLFVAALVPVRLCFRFIGAPVARVVRETVAIAAGAAPGLVILLCFKVFLSPPSEFAGALVADRLFDFARYREVVGIMAHYAPAFGGDNGPSPAWLLIPSVILIGSGIRRDARNSFASMVALIGLMIVGYSLLYQITPHPLDWHVWTSLDRLMIQLWPAFLFTFFASMGSKSFEDSGVARFKSVYAVAPAVAAVIAFWFVARALPTPPATVPAPSDGAPARATAHFFSVLPGSGPQAGWAQLEVSSVESEAIWLMQSYAPNGSTAAEASTAPVYPAVSGVIPVVETGKVAVAMVNPGDTPVSVEVSCGAERTASFTISPAVKVAALIEDAPFNLKGCSSALRFDASGNLGTLALLTSEVPGNEAMMEIPIAYAERMQEQPIHIPYVVTADGQQPVLVLTNPKDVPLSGRYRWLDSNGVELSAGAYQVPSRGAERYNLSGRSNASSAGRVEVVPDSGSAVPDAFAIVGEVTAVRGQAASQGFKALVENAEGLVESLLAVVNPGDRPAMVHLEMSGPVRSDARSGDRSILVPPHGQVVDVVVRGQFKGVVRVSSDEPIAVTVVRNRVVQGRPVLLSTVAAAVEEPAPLRSGMRIFPHIASGRSYGAEVVLATPAQLEIRGQ